MHSVTYLLEVLVLSVTVFGACSPPILGKDNAQCNTGNFNGCVAAKTVELSALCNGDPALESACLQQASLRANKECGSFCMDVTDCTSCLKSIELLGLNQDVCSTGDMTYCEC